MEPPIIAWEPNDMSVYETIKEAETHLEPWMCEFTRIFDRQGQRLVLEVGQGWRMNKLCEIEPGKADEAGLRQALLQFLAAVGIRDNLNGHSTDELLAMATPFAAVPKPRLGVLADFVLDFLRWVGGKKPLQARKQSRRERPTK
jgi:hypothetical protein